jgi:hypothetical protein
VSRSASRAGRRRLQRGFRRRRTSDRPRTGRTRTSKQVGRSARRAEGVAGDSDASERCRPSLRGLRNGSWDSPHQPLTAPPPLADAVAKISTVTRRIARVVARRARLPGRAPASRAAARRVAGVATAAPYIFSRRANSAAGRVVLGEATCRLVAPRVTLSPLGKLHVEKTGGGGRGLSSEPVRCGTHGVQSRISRERRPDREDHGGATPP